MALTENPRAGDFLLSEANGTQSREAITVSSAVAAVLDAGTVLGRIDRRQAAAPIPTNAGTGTGAMTLLTFGPEVQVGSYVIELTETSATAAFTVTAPDGTSLPNGAVGTAYKSNHLSFLISDGGTMTDGDTYTVVVTAAGTPVVVGTGDGVMSAITLGKLAQLGTYKVVNQLAATNQGTFHVIAPDGSDVGHGIVASGGGGTLVFTSDHVNFTITDGSTDFVLNDYFNIIVATHTNKAVEWNPLAVDGSQIAYGILFQEADASTADVGNVAIVRNAEVDLDELTWKSTVTAAQKTEAIRQLGAANVLFRS